MSISTVKLNGAFYGTLITLLFCPLGLEAQDDTGTSFIKFPTYVLAPNDVVQIKVYQ